MQTKDFQIINGGFRSPLGYNNRILIEFLHGSGSGDQSEWCEFFSTYRVYKQLGSDLVECGKIEEIDGSDRASFKGEVDGKPVSCDFLTASAMFTRIEKIIK